MSVVDGHLLKANKEFWEVQWHAHAELYTKCLVTHASSLNYAGIASVSIC